MRRYSLIAIAAFGLAVSADGIYAIPNMLLNPHLNDGTTIQWEEDGTPDGLPDACPGSSHNHRDTDTFRGLADNGEPYSAWKVWDDRFYRVDSTGAFSCGHGYIEETAGVVRYRFVGGGWPADAQARVRDAFAAFSAITSDVASLITGIEFREFDGNRDLESEISIEWGDIEDAKRCGGMWNPGTRTLRFDRKRDDAAGTPFNWSFAVAPPTLAGGEAVDHLWHFYSVALHEIGHLVAFAHQSDAGDLMTPMVGVPLDPTEDIDPGANILRAASAACGPAGKFYTAIDADTVDGVRDLYSIPASPTPTPSAAPTPSSTPTGCANIKALDLELIIPLGGDDDGDSDEDEGLTDEDDLDGYDDDGDGETDEDPPNIVFEETTVVEADAIIVEPGAVLSGGPERLVELELILTPTNPDCEVIPPSQTSMQTLTPGEPEDVQAQFFVECDSPGPAEFTAEVKVEWLDGTDCDESDNFDNATVTFSVVSALNHFMCHELERQPFDRFPVSLADRFASGTVEIARPKRLCNPADLDGQPPTVPSDPEHLVAYEIKDADFTKVFDQKVVDEFGTLFVDIVRPEFLMVPSHKSLLAPPPPVTDPELPHFTCYRVRRAQFRTDGLAVIDQLGSYTVNLKKPFRLCVPTSKNGSGISDPKSNLLCYKQRSVPRRPPITSPIYIDNQFGPKTFEVTRTREFCVPAELNPVPVPTPTATPQAPTPTPTSTP